MGWEYSDTNCKFANVCSSSPRCTAKNKNECILWEKDNRNWFQKHIFTNWNEILTEFKIKENNIKY